MASASLAASSRCLPFLSSGITLVFDLTRPLVTVAASLLAHKPSLMPIADPRTSRHQQSRQWRLPRQKTGPMAYRTSSQGQTEDRTRATDEAQMVVTKGIGMTVTTVTGGLAKASLGTPLLHQGLQGANAIWTAVACVCRIVDGMKHLADEEVGASQRHQEEDGMKVPECPGTNHLKVSRKGGETGRRNRLSWTETGTATTRRVQW